jgi:hypothetical protein
MCYNYCNLESAIISCSYDLSISKKSIRQSKPVSLVTDTRDNIKIHVREIACDSTELR